MECKGWTLQWFCLMRNSINRNIMECKGRITMASCGYLAVLIETLWNVKTGAKGFKVSSDGVLIETLWNVKRISDITLISTGLVLIETLWNVKRDNGVPIYWDYQVLIETLWNVKSHLPE